MPRTTHAYGFEMKVAGFAGELCARFTAGQSPRPFVLELDRGGSVTRIQPAPVGPGGRLNWIQLR